MQKQQKQNLILNTVCGASQHIKYLRLDETDK